MKVLILGPISVLAVGLEQKLDHIPVRVLVLFWVHVKNKYERLYHIYAYKYSYYINGYHDNIMYQFLEKPNRKPTHLSEGW